VHAAAHGRRRPGLRAPLRGLPSNVRSHQLLVILPSMHAFL
jgi:hypothetical protein